MKWIKWVRKRGEGRLDTQGKRNKILDKEKVKDTRGESERKGKIGFNERYTDIKDREDREERLRRPERDREPQRTHQ